MDEHRPTASQARWRLTLGSGPLTRTSDRLEFLARVLLACCLVLVVPVALVVASAAHAQALTEGRAQSLERHQVDAEVVADPPVLGSGSDGVPTTARAPAVWRGPSGREHTSVVVVPLGSRTGSSVPVWVDRDGDLTTRPLTSGDAVARAIGTGMGTCVLIAVLAVGLFLTFRVLLDRSRLRRWAVEWAVVEPVWTRTVP